MMDFTTFMDDLHSCNMDVILTVFLFLLVIFVICKFFNLYRKALKSTFPLRGACPKNEFYGFIVVHCSLIAFLSFFYCGFHDGALSEIGELAFYIMEVYFVATIIPLLSVLVRRYHTVKTSRSSCCRKNDASVTTSKRFCSECGAENPLSAKFCSDCGSMLADRSSKQLQNGR